MTSWREKTDVLIIGAGIGGLSAALRAAERGKSVLILTKQDNPLESNTYYAQGGIVSRGDQDSAPLLEEDILRAGSSWNYREAVSLVAREAPEAVNRWLIRGAQVPFNRRNDGGEEFDFTREGAHSVRRILHVYDKTGQAIEESLSRLAGESPRIKFWTGFTAVDLVTNSHNSDDPQQRYLPRRVIGAYVLNNESGRIGLVFAPSVVLATGGVGTLYHHSSNPPGATGDGIAMAYRAGAEILNAEFIQFHPTTLYHRDVDNFLITEALRGEGARLMNSSGDYFMQEYEPELKDLAPRDRVARAIYREMEREGRGYVFLDARGLGGVDVAERFPAVYEKCLSVGIDILSEPIPVVPAAHYFCGGVKVDLHGRTGVQGLYAVGECSCTGVHGANRLASVSLLEGLVYGLRAGEAAPEGLAIEDSLEKSIPDWVYPTNEKDFDPVLIRNDLKNIQITLWNYVGIIRTPKRILRALSDIDYMSHRIERFYKEAVITRELLELRNSVVTASLIARAANLNPRSVGCHYIQGGSG